MKNMSKKSLNIGWMFKERVTKNIRAARMSYEQQCSTRRSKGPLALNLTIQLRISSAEIATSDILDLVRVEWFTDRSVKVKIRQSVLTFST